MSDAFSSPETRRRSPGPGHEARSWILIERLRVPSVVLFAAAGAVLELSGMEPGGSMTLIALSISLLIPRHIGALESSIAIRHRQLDHDELVAA